MNPLPPKRGTPAHKLVMADAIDWAKHMIDLNAIVLDTETTGIGDQDEVIQLAAMTIDGAVEKVQFFCPMKTKPSTKAVEVHGLSWEKLRNKDHFGTVYPKLRTMLKGKSLVAYNAAFDSRLLEQTIRIAGLEVFPTSWDCAMLKYAAYWGEINHRKRSYRWHKLTVARERHNLEVDGEAHDALVDVKLTIELIKWMAEQNPSNEVGIKPTAQSQRDETPHDDFGPLFQEPPPVEDQEPPPPEDVEIPYLF